MLSAILNCDLAWYFQADKPIESFGPDTNIHMIMENMYKIPDSCVDISEAQCSLLEEKIGKALYLSENNEKFYLATNAMWSYRLNFMPAIRVGVIWSGIESLFMIDKNIKKTIAVVSSRFIYGNDDRVEEIKRLYKDARCKAIHEYRNGSDELLDKSNKLLFDLIQKCIDEGNTPNIASLLRNK